MLLLLLLKGANDKVLYLDTGIRSLHCTLWLKARSHHPRRSHVLVIGGIHFEAKVERSKVQPLAF